MEVAIGVVVTVVTMEDDYHLHCCRYVDVAPMTIGFGQYFLQV